VGRSEEALAGGPGADRAEAKEILAARRGIFLARDPIQKGEQRRGPFTARVRNEQLFVLAGDLQREGNRPHQNARLLAGSCLAHFASRLAPLRGDGAQGRDIPAGDHEPRHTAPGHWGVPKP
jgi:hypothetical protein